MRDRPGIPKLGGSLPEHVGPQSLQRDRVVAAQLDQEGPRPRGERPRRGPAPEFTFTDVFVADEDVLGEVGQGYELTKEWFTDERLMIAARTVGAAERALTPARDWAVERQQFGAPIASYQLIQGMLADSAVDIAVNRAYTHQVAWEADNGTDRKTLHAKASIAKLSASEAAGRVIDRCLQIFGELTKRGMRALQLPGAGAASLGPATTSKTIAME